MLQNLGEHDRIVASVGHFHAVVHDFAFVLNYRPASGLSMLQAAHIFLAGLYVALPPLAFLAMFRVARRRGMPPSRLLPSITVAIASSLLLGIAASIIYDLWLGGIVPPLQMLLTCYWAAGLICILKLLDYLIDQFVRLLFATSRGSWKRHQRQSAAQACRILLLFIIGLPYMIVAASTYRPKGIERNETDWLSAGATPITFESSDGLPISGFWTLASPPSAGDMPNPRWGHETLIICPGARGGRTSYLPLASAFLSDGYNVLSFDFRGNGLSGGEIVSFGDHERRDILGAIKWLRENQPVASRRIVGVGIDTGAAALIAAAADPSTEGHALDAIAVFGCYDRFPSLAASAATISFPPPLQWLIVPVALPLACVQTGADLWHFDPVDLVTSVAPRPVLFIHARRDPVITFDHGVALYQAASLPKSHIWLDDSTDDKAINSSSVIIDVIRFMNTAVPML
jgi:fermentation-respiration switch protein FrsA (DUF1100 family)